MSALDVVSDIFDKEKAIDRDSLFQLADLKGISEEELNAALYVLKFKGKIGYNDDADIYFLLSENILSYRQRELCEIHEIEVDVFEEFARDFPTCVLNAFPTRSVRTAAALEELFNHGSTIDQDIYDDDVARLKKAIASYKYYKKICRLD